MLSPKILPLLFKTVPARKIRQEKEIKGIQITKEVKLSLFTAGIILYSENPKKSTFTEFKKLYNKCVQHDCQIDQYIKIEYKNIQKPILFSCTIKE